MVRERIPMYNVLEVLRQRYQEKVSSVRKIAQSVNISRPTVQKYLDLAVAVGIGYWPLREETGDLGTASVGTLSGQEGVGEPGNSPPGLARGREGTETEKEKRGHP